MAVAAAPSPSWLAATGLPSCQSRSRRSSTPGPNGPWPRRNGAMASNHCRPPGCTSCSRPIDPPLQPWRGGCPASVLARSHFCSILGHADLPRLIPGLDTTVQPVAARVVPPLQPLIVHPLPRPARIASLSASRHAGDAMPSAGCAHVAGRGAAHHGADCDSFRRGRKRRPNHSGGAPHECSHVAPSEPTSAGRPAASLKKRW